MIANSRQIYNIKSVLANSNSPIEQIEVMGDGLIYSSLDGLFLDKEKIDLLNSPKDENGNFSISDIQVKKDKFYLSSNLGTFENYRRIFYKEPSNHIAIGKDQVFIAAKSGIYSSNIEKNNNFFNYHWAVIPQSPPESKYLLLNKSKSQIKYVSSSQGFYYFDPKKNKWINRSSGLERDFQDSFGLGRFINIGKKERIILPSNAGIFISNNEGKNWKKKNQGLKSNSDGFFTLREVIEFNEKLFLISSTGLYYSEPENISWQKIEIPNSRKNEEFGNDIYSITKTKDAVLIGDSNGKIYEIKEKDLLSQNIQVEEYKPLNNLNLKIKKIIDLEPNIREVHKAALDFAGIPTGKKFNGYKLQARLRNLLPSFEAYADTRRDTNISIETDDTDDFDSGSGGLKTRANRVDLNRNNNGKNLGMRLSWKLNNLIYDPEVNDLNTNARITANIRENLLTEITQIFFSRKELLVDLLKEKLTDENNIFSRNYLQKKMNLEEYTAQIDARTGGWFTSELDKKFKQEYI